MKGGTIIIGGDAGAFTGFMMQRGRIIILGDVGINLGDSMYDGTIFVGGEIGSYGSDAVDAELTKEGAKIAEIKGKIDEVEVFPENTLEWWFVPIRTGEFNDLFCGIKDKKSGKLHAEMGMKGQIIIEQLGKKKPDRKSG